MKEIELRPAVEADFDAMWAIFQVLVAAGDTYTFDTGATREDCHELWRQRGIR